MRLRPELDFGFLEALEVDQLFTLKAFLEHGTLTMEEHGRIFRLPPDQSYQLFESLLNRHLLTAGASAGEEEPPEERRRRYRINPLLLGGVGTVLAARNVLH